MAYIYKVTSPSGKIYIGSSVSAKRRFGQYKRLDCRGQTKLYHSFLKHGVENHLFEIITECDKSQMLLLEAKYGNLFNSLHPKGLNLSLPKIGEVYGGLSEETKKKIGDKIRGRKHTDEQKRINSERKKGNKNLLGFKFSEESKLKMSLAKKGIPRPERLGVKLSEEHKKKLSLAKKGKPGSRTGSKLTPEQIQKMSQRVKLWWANKKSA